MILATSRSDVMLKKSLGKGQTTITTLERMCEQFKLDPTTATPVRDAYVITNEDISSTKTKTLFEQSLATKHPATKIIFINKSTKPIYQNGLAGIDAILQKPKPQTISQTISAVISADTMIEEINRAPTTIGEIPVYNPETVHKSEPITESAQPDIKEEEEEVKKEELILDPVTEFKDVPVTEIMQEESNIVKRIKSAGSVADVSIIAREIQATTLIKDLVESNSTYAGIEEKLKSLNDIIMNILSDVRIKSLDEKLSKIRAVLHDKAFFASKGDTLIEQRLEEVIDAICSQTSALLQTRLDEIDTAIRRSRECKDMGTNNTRLSGLNEIRANLTLELRTLETEIADIFRSTDRLIISTATKLSEASDKITDNEMINTQLKARESYIISDETHTAVRAALELASDKVPEEFKILKLKIVSMNKLLSKLCDIDDEIIAAQQVLINFLKSKNVEDSVIVEGLLKKALRVYIGSEGTGTTIIPYLLSRYKSRQNANVLIVDLTGFDKYKDYGIQYTNIDSYLAEMNQKEFMLVAGKIDNTIEAAQRIVTTLIKAADYYRVINVVLTPQQRELYETIAQDVLSVNFITDTNVKNINEMREVIERSSFPNVGRRVIINKCDVPVRPIITKLGLDDQIDFQLCTIRTIPALVDASLNGYNPYGISSVDFEMEEVLKHA